MTVCIALESADQVGPDLRWPLRIAAGARGPLHLVVPAGEHAGNGALDLSAAGASRLADALRGALDAEFGGEGWAPADDEAEEAPAEEGAPLAVRAQLVAPEGQVEAVTGAVGSAGDLLVVVFVRMAGADTSWDEQRRQVLERVTCPIAFVRPGQRQADGEILMALAPGSHARDAARLAAGLAERTGRPLTGLYVEPDIGPDARRVGRRILDKLLDGALDHEATRPLERRVELDERAADGVIRVAAEERYELLVVGVSRLGSLGQRTQAVAVRVEKSAPEPTLIAVRSPMPFGSRVRRWVDGQLLRRIPQLARDDRVGLVERIQSQSQWNTDYVLLMGLSTLIAALGLLDDSPAVIIGAMLVAPLMTPLLGLGVAIPQGNPRLARMAIKAVLLGFVTAFALALLVGMLSPHFLAATEEMNVRSWPHEDDLAIAFLGGLAAAYASGRPGLLAALPGVAIAAALLPPIATAGLAVAIGDFDLALGSLLLFAVNIISIVMAAASVFWSMGLRQIRTPTAMTRVAGAVLSAAVLAMAIGLAFAPPRMAASAALVAAVEGELDPGFRIRDIRLRKEAQGWVVQIDLGGGGDPSPALAARLLGAARAQLGSEVDLRLTHRYEVLVE